jgi:hypothetical protein
MLILFAFKYHSNNKSYCIRRLNKKKSYTNFAVF